jgi:hypothetical protein
MLRWLGILLAIGLTSASADAQVFKPKPKKAAAPDKSEKKKAAAEPSAKKQSRAAPTKKRVATKKKVKPARDDEAPESESKDTDKDYVKIWDDDEIE